MSGNKLVNMRKPEDIQYFQKIVDDSGGNDMVALEIGSYRGQSAELFVKTGKIKKIYCVDPWKNGYDKKDMASSSDMAAVENDFDSRAAANPQMRKFKGVLSDFVETLHDQIDIVYVDACHTYEGCRDDLLLCAERVKPRLAYAGHDYVAGWPGVVKAVDEVFGKPDFTYGDGSWLKLVK